MNLVFDKSSSRMDTHAWYHSTNGATGMWAMTPCQLCVCVLKRHLERDFKGRASEDGLMFGCPIYLSPFYSRKHFLSMTSFHLCTHLPLHTYYVLGTISGTAHSGKTNQVLPLGSKF